MYKLQFHWRTPYRLPLLPPGVLVELDWCDATIDPGRQADRRRSTCGRRPVSQITVGRRRIQIRCSEESGQQHVGLPVVRCRLTAFAYPPDAVDELARSISGRELRRAREELQERSPGPELRRDVQIYLLLRLQAGRTLRAAERSNPQFVSVWRALVNTEHRRMLRRLQRAVHRLERGVSNQSPGEPGGVSHRINCDFTLRRSPA